MDDHVGLPEADLGPHVEDAVRSFEGSVLQRVYVEQDVVLQSDLEPGKVVKAKPLTAAVREWLARDRGTLLTLLGDFGSGKTSFCRVLAHELAREARADPEGAKRSPFFVDLREGGSTTVTLENLLVHRCQQLTSQPVNVQALLRLNTEGHLILIFDGFDEILGYSEPARFLEKTAQSACGTRRTAGSSPYSKATRKASCRWRGIPPERESPPAP